MKVSELTIGQGSVDVEGTIKEVGELRVFSKFGRELRVADAILEDDSGTVKLTLWNEDTEKVSVGDIVHIENGYVGEYQGELQLTSGKFGKIEIVGKEEGGQAPVEEAPVEEEPKEEPKEQESLSEEPVVEEESIE